jgi:hypothetical protein
MRNIVRFLSKYYLVVGGSLLLLSWSVERYLYDKWDSRISVFESNMAQVRYLKLDYEIVAARGSIEATLSILDNNLQNLLGSRQTPFKEKDKRDEYTYTIPDISYNVRKYNKLIYKSMSNALSHLVACLPKDENEDIYTELDSVQTYIDSFLRLEEIYDLNKSKVIDEMSNSLLRKTTQRLNDLLTATLTVKQRWRKMFTFLYILGTIIIIFGRLRETKTKVLHSIS